MLPFQQRTKNRRMLKVMNVAYSSPARVALTYPREHFLDITLLGSNKSNTMSSSVKRDSLVLSKYAEAKLIQTLDTSFDNDASKCKSVEIFFSNKLPALTQSKDLSVQRDHVYDVEVKLRNESSFLLDPANRM